MQDLATTHMLICQHRLHPLAIIKGDDHQPGPQQAGCQQDVAPAGIAKCHLLPRRLGLAHPLGIEIQREKGDLLELEEAGTGLPGAPEAGDDDVLVLAEPRLGDPGAGQQGRVGKGVGQPQGPLHQPGGERKGDDADADEQRDHLVTEQAMVARQRQQHEAELADAGAELVVSTCSACHSLEYITTQPRGMGGKLPPGMLPPR